MYSLHHMHVTQHTIHYTLYIIPAIHSTIKLSREMVVGHVRQELDWDDCDDLEDCDNDVISLTMFQPSVTRDQVIYSSY